MPSPTRARPRQMGRMEIAAAGIVLALLVGWGAPGLGHRLGKGPGHRSAVTQGRRYLERGHPDLAFRAVYPIREGEPAAGEALTVAGLALLQLDDRGGARLLLERGLKLRPDQPDAAKALGEIYLGSGDVVRGVRNLRLATELDPSDGRSWVALGRAYRQCGVLDRAANAYARALSLSPGDREALAGRIDALLSAYHIEEASAPLTEARRRWPDDPRLLGLAARQAGSLGRTAEALDLAGRALAADPTNLDALRERARVHLRTGQYPRALQELERAVAAHPRDLQALYMLTLTELRLGLSERAARTQALHQRTRERAALMVRLQGEISRRPMDPEPRRRLAQLAREEGRTDLARGCSQAALDLDATIRPAREGSGTLRRSPTPTPDPPGNGL